MGTARPFAVGAIIRIRDDVSAVVSLLPVDFGRLWLFALSDHLKYASLTFTPPKYGSALVVNASFSSEREEQGATGHGLRFRPSFVQRSSQGVEPPRH